MQKRNVETDSPSYKQKCYSTVISLYTNSIKSLQKTLPIAKKLHLDETYKEEIDNIIDSISKLRNSTVNAYELNVLVNGKQDGSEKQ